MNSLKLVAAIVCATIVVVFGAQNTQRVTFHFLMFSVPSAPMVLALFLAALLGALLGWIVLAPGRFRNMRERRGLREQVAAQAESPASEGPTNAAAISPPSTHAPGTSQP
jgi:uncharacterized integral membrane protein